MLHWTSQGRVDLGFALAEGEGTQTEMQHKSFKDAKAKQKSKPLQLLQYNIIVIINAFTVCM